MATETQRAIEAVWRIESARVIAALARMVRDVGLAEELAQDALVAALETWPAAGIPDNPGAWLMTTARRRGIDRLRRARRIERKHEELGYELDQAEQRAADLEAAIDDPIGDDLLRLIFTSCHPVLPTEGRVALTLRVVGGLTTGEIARAFVAPEPTIAQRIVRAKRTLAEAKVPFEVPRGPELADRLSSVLEVIYLIFNEGYAATSGDAHIRADLCAEALRLGATLVDLLDARPELGAQPEALGLLALMRLHDARRAARLDAAGDIVLLEDQERRLWNRVAIDAGLALLDRALALRRPGPYQIQAAIAALHVRAATAADTDWPQIAALYGALLRHAPTPVVELNRAVAVGMARGPLAGLALLQRPALAEALDGYHWYHAAVADFLRRAGYRPEARAAYVRALSQCDNRAEQAFLARRIDETS